MRTYSDHSGSASERYRLFYLLEVPTTASDEEIHAAFERHVHRVGGLIENVPLHIRRAFDILANPGRRQAYLDLIHLASTAAAFRVDDPDVRMLFEDICSASGLTIHEWPRAAGLFMVCFPGFQPGWTSRWGKARLLCGDLVRIAARLRNSKTAKRGLFAAVVLVAGFLSLLALDSLSTALAQRRHRELVKSVHLQCVAAEQELEALCAGLASLESEFQQGIGVTLDESRAGRIPPGIDSLLLRREPVRNSFAFIETAWLAAIEQQQQAEVLWQAKARVSVGRPADSDPKMLRELALHLKERRDLVHEARLDLNGIVDIINVEKLALPGALK